ncbi:PhzF family phenazine biosynthesis protein [Vibrio sp.]|nr:PhzF family phenazine biosynthesis protein [Vibrio sp.]
MFTSSSQTDKVQFYAESVGQIEVKLKGDGQIEMNFPNHLPVHLNIIPTDLIDGLSIPPKEVLINEQAYFVIYDRYQDVLEVKQYPEWIKKLGPRDVVVTAKADNEEFDFVSRYFWPATGGDEDPVTGSAHTGLAPYWSKQLNKDKLIAYQASERGGVLYCSIKGDRVLISGYVVPYLVGQITI